jgi:hypothetical protein
MLATSFFVNIFALTMDISYFTISAFGVSPNGILLILALMLSTLNCFNIVKIFIVPSALSALIAVATTIALVTVYTAQIILYFVQNPNHIVTWQISILVFIFVLFLTTISVLYRYHDFTVYNYVASDDEESNQQSVRESDRQSSLAGMRTSLLLGEGRLTDE